MFLKHLPVVKNQLFHSILKQLKQYLYVSSVKNELLELLQDADILIQKSMYKEAYKLLQKAEKLAEKNEYFLFCLEIYDRLLMLNYNLPFDKKANDYSLEIYQKQMSVFSKVGEINELKYLRSYRNDIEFSVFDKEERDKQYADLLKNKLMDEDFDYSSYKSGIIYHHLRARIFMQFSTKESEIEAYQLNLKFLKHMESNPDLL